SFFFFFFFQAEDGIRARNVTGVQTCALPICNLFHLILLRCRICVYELCIEGRGKTWKLKGLMKTQLSFTSLMYILRIAVLKEKIFGIIASVVYNYFGK